MEKLFVVVVCGVSNEQASAGVSGLFTEEQANEYIRIAKERDQLAHDFDYLPSYHMTEVSVETGIKNMEEEKERLAQQIKSMEFEEQDELLPAQSDEEVVTEPVEQDVQPKSIEEMRDDLRERFSSKS